MFRIKDEADGYIPLKQSFEVILMLGDDSEVTYPVTLNGTQPVNTLNFTLGDDKKSAKIDQQHKLNLSEPYEFHVSVIGPSGQTLIDKRLIARIPLETIPVDTTMPRKSSIVHDTKIINTGAPNMGYTPDSFLEQLNQLRQPLNCSHIMWIQGPYGSGKSSFIEKFKSHLQLENWCLVDLTHLAIKQNMGIPSLVGCVVECLDKYTGLGEGPTAAALQGDQEQHEFARIQAIQKHYSVILTKKYLGIVFLLDEFDQAWKGQDGSKPNVTPDEVIEQLKTLMKAVPYSRQENSTPRTAFDIPTFVVIADYLHPEKRLTEQYLQQLNNSQSNVDRPLTLHKHEIDPRYTLEDIKKIVSQLVPPRLRKDANITTLSSRIFAWTTGHRTCTNLLLYEYYDYCYQNRKSIQTLADWPHLDVIFGDESVRKKIEKKLQALLDVGFKIAFAPNPHHISTQRTTPEEKKLLGCIFEKERQREQHPSTGIEAVLDSLLSKGLLIKRNDQYFIANPLLKWYLASLDKSGGSPYACA